MDDEEFVAFVDARYTALVRFGALLTGDAGHGEDLAQSALLSSYRRRRAIDEAPEAYVRQVMARMAWRSARRRWWGERPSSDSATLALAGTDDGAQARADADAVRGALRRLPEAQRIVLVLRYWGGSSEAEIAAQLGCSAGTVKSRASRALAALRADPGLRPELDDLLGSSPPDPSGPAAATATPARSPR